MNLSSENLLFIRSLQNNLDSLRAVLGGDWAGFRDELSQLSEELARVESGEEATRIVDQIIAYGLRTAAADVFRELFDKAIAESVGNSGAADSRAGVNKTPATDRQHEYKMRDAGTPVGPLRGALVGEPANTEGAAEGGGAGVPLRSVADAARTLAESLKRAGDGVTDGRDAGPRFLNTFFTAPNSEAVLSADTPLVSGRTYSLHVDISARRRGPEDVASPFPDSALTELIEDRGALPLTVVAAALDFDVEPRLQTLRLPQEGPSEEVIFSLRPRAAGERCAVQVDVFYLGYLLQSKRLDVYVASPEAAGPSAAVRPAQVARVTFTTTSRLTPENLKRLPERILTVDVEGDQRDGSIDLRFLDRTDGNKELAFYDTRLQPASLGNAVRGIREMLLRTVVGEEQGGRRTKGYQRKLQGDEALLAAWLPRLANAGHSLYRAILPANENRELDRGDRLRAALRPGTIIQINPVVGNVTIPWALMYEREVKHVPGKNRLCDRFFDEGHDPAQCPAADDPYVICPLSFWGYRYVIEQLPCWVGDELPAPPDVLRVISNGQPLCLNLNVWRDFSYWRDHVPKIAVKGQVEALVAETVSELEDIWKQHSSDLDVVYFYCHGGTDDVMNQPFLQISDGCVDSNFIEACKLKWPHHPLVFLNGCGTGSYGPESYVSLLNDFRKAGASGVIGTECPVPELFAESYAASLFPYLFRGERLGQAMLHVRLEFLRERLNPLGLAYTLYAASEIALANPLTQG